MSHPENPDERPEGAGNTKSFRFSGEDPPPVFGDPRHTGIDTSYLEVSPEQLIDVAKHLWREGNTHQDVIQRAYQIICEAHLTSGNIRQWNEKVNQDHFPKVIFDLVERAATNDRGQPFREPLLAAFMKSRGIGEDPTNARKRFIRWITESLRREDYKATILKTKKRGIFAKDFYKHLEENGWMQWHEDGGTRHVILPARISPKKTLQQEPASGEHVTKPYWGTKDAWWPVPDKETIEKRKSKYLNTGRDAFLSPLSARKALEEFGEWLELEEKLKKAPARKTQPRNATGVLVSPKDKGAGRSPKGRFGKE